MERYIIHRCFSLNYLCLILLLIFATRINAQNNNMGEKQQRKTDSLYLSSGITKIAEQIYKNHWIKYKPQTRFRENAFFKENKQKYGLKNQDELILDKVITDDAGYAHYRYFQEYKGLKVEFSEIILHVQNGLLIKSSGSVVPDIHIDTKPTLSEDLAFNSVKDYISSRFSEHNKNKSTALKKKTTELVILPQNSKLGISEDHLVYKFTVYQENPLYGAAVYVDANSGSIIFKDPMIYSADALGQAITRYSGLRPITSNYIGNGVYVLQDFSRASCIKTLDMNNDSVFSHAVDFIDYNDNYWGPMDEGYDVHWGIEQTYDYYYNNFGRNSFDDNGKEIKSYVHYHYQFVNAYWNESDKYLVFGDGRPPDYNPLTCLDIVSHEFTHGITNYTANLVYENEPGALNESFSDIFGIVIEKYAKGSTDWLIGAEFTHDNTYIRSLSNPNNYGVYADSVWTFYSGPDWDPQATCVIVRHGIGQPDTYEGNFWYSRWNCCAPSDLANDNNGVHINSGVQNYWFYLLSQGGTGTNDKGYSYNVSGIGINNAAAIAYRNLTVYLSPSSDYQDARQGSIEAASDLFGNCSNEVTQVINAWNAVGVEGPALVNTDIYACGALEDGAILIASDNIYAGNSCGGDTAIIESGNKVILRAGSRISLGPVFQAKSGSTLKANVLSCGNGVLKITGQPVQIKYNETRIDSSSNDQFNYIMADTEYLVYPNPTTGQINIKANSYKEQQIYITIYSLSGNILYKEILNIPEFSVDVSRFSSGLYIVLINDGNKITTAKIFKE
ncbi:MAG: M4 family metallopeptidase [Bacteroidales bacterium]|nr:M4 family metallopeptidase [Bacteroidales bacterium]